jgi:hypothetical protein
VGRPSTPTQVLALLLDLPVVGHREEGVDPMGVEHLGDRLLERGFCGDLPLAATAGRG